jgi:TonB family protein
MRMSLPLLASFLAFSSAAPVAAAPMPRSPTGPWVVDFAEQQCLASRPFGTADKPLFLGLKPSPAGEIVQVVVVLKARTAMEANEEPVTIRIGDHLPLTANELSFRGKTADLRQVQINLTADQFAPMREASTVSFESRDLNESFALSQMPALMKEMDRCVADLRRHWNMDANPPLRSRASTNLRNLINSEDYPALATRNEEGGTVRFALLVDEKGRVADCVVTQTSRVPALDAQACVLITARAHFKPAIDATGKPARDAVMTSVTWRIG